MTHNLAYIYHEDSIEVTVGLLEDLVQKDTCKQTICTFATEQDLFDALQPLRHQGKMITIVSPLAKLRFLWNES